MTRESAGVQRPNWAWPEGIWPESAWAPGWDEPLEEWDGEEPTDVEVSTVAPEHGLDLDLLRWTWAPGGSDGLPGPEEVLRGLYRRLAPDPEQSTLGAYLCAEESETYRVAAGTTPGYAWVADRYQLHVRPRKAPWTVLRDSAAEVQRIHLAEVLDGVILEHWRSGARVRQVQLGLTGNPVSRGELQDFERGIWDGTVPRRTSSEATYREVPPEQRIDIDALIAAEPPEHLEVQEDGTRLLYLTPPRTHEIVQYLPEGRGYGSGFVSGGLGTEEDPEIYREFLNLDTLNSVAVWDDEEDEWWVDPEPLVRGALEAWFGLTGSRCSWDWPCQVWTVP